MAAPSTTTTMNGARSSSATTATPTATARASRTNDPPGPVKAWVATSAASRAIGTRSAPAAMPAEPIPIRTISAVHALDTPTPLGPDASASPAFVGFNMFGKVIARGLLTGKYTRDGGVPAGSRAEREPERAGWLRDADWDRIEALQAFADAREISLLTLAIGGLAAQPAVASVISGATRPEQVAANPGSHTGRFLEDLVEPEVRVAPRSRRRTKGAEPVAA